MSDKKYFDQTVKPACALCVHARELSGGSELFCIKRGPRDRNEACRSYKYDPFKREPKSSDFGRDYDPSSFSL